MQREIENRLGSDPDLLSTSRRLYRSAASTTDGCANRRSSASASDSTDQSAKGSAAADNRCGPFASRSALLLYVAAGDGICCALIRKVVQRNGELAAAGDFARTAGADEFEHDVQALRDDHCFVYGDGAVESGLEGLPGLVHRGIDGVDCPHLYHGALGNRYRDSLRF